MREHPLERFHLLCSVVSAGFEAVSAVGGGDLLDGVGDRVSEFETASWFQPLQDRLELREDFLDRVQVGGIRWQKT